MDIPLTVHEHSMNIHCIFHHYSNYITTRSPLLGELIWCEKLAEILVSPILTEAVPRSQGLLLSSLRENFAQAQNQAEFAPFR